MEKNSTAKKLITGFHFSRHKILLAFTYRVAQKSKLLYCVNSLLFLSHPVHRYARD